MRLNVLREGRAVVSPAAQLRSNSSLDPTRMQSSHPWQPSPQSGGFVHVRMFIYKTPRPTGIPNAASSRKLGASGVDNFRPHQKPTLRSFFFFLFFSFFLFFFFGKDGASAVQSDVPIPFGE